MIAVVFIAGLALLTSGCATRGELAAESLERRQAGRTHEMRVLTVADSLDSAVQVFSGEIERLQKRVSELERAIGWDLGKAARAKRLAAAARCAAARADGDDFLVKALCAKAADGEGAYR